MAASSAAGGGVPAKKENIIAELVGKVVCIVTLEGRCLVGTLRGIDSVNNLVLENSHERTFHADRGMEMEPMGLYLVRGDSLCVPPPPFLFSAAAAAAAAARRRRRAATPPHLAPRHPSPAG
jgi:small nuclear ribonucleoprotein (snRNP)-like protein